MNLKYKQWIDGIIGRALASVNVVLVRGVGLMLRRNHSIEKAPANILVIKMLGIGSVLMAMDSLYSLKLKYPNSRFILMSGKGVAAGIAQSQYLVMIAGVGSSKPEVDYLVTASGDSVSVSVVTWTGSPHTAYPT
jgi:hypothetical protein